MKKLSFIIVALMALAGALQSSAQMRWGATAGIDITNMKWSQKSFRNEPFKSTKSLGYTAGIIGEYEIPGIGFGIDLGLQYAQRGASFNMGDFEIWNSDGYGNERSYLHYLDIPIHLRFKYSNLNGFERKLCPFVFVGPELSILLAHNKLRHRFIRCHIIFRPQLQCFIIIQHFYSQTFILFQNLYFTFHIGCISDILCSWFWI